MRVGLIGGGAITHTLAKAAADRHLEGITFVGVVGSGFPPSRRVQTAADLLKAPVLTLSDMLQRKPNWVLEAAGVKAAKLSLPELMEQRVGVVLMSAGVLADPQVLSSVRHYERDGGRVVIPSGAIGGLDAIRALNATGGLHRVTITSTKHPAGLSGAPYLKQHAIELPDDRPITVFEGSAKEAIASFPANINVAVVLSLASLGIDRTQVVIRSDPGAKQSTHVIKAEGEAGQLEVKLHNNTDPSNPRTSWLAALSAVATLQRLAESAQGFGLKGTVT